ncbi:MAG: hypothetical protein JWP97_5157 [Labilithrix sp.]|nr:hypothetical protein [Labilithrix sp.]
MSFSSRVLSRIARTSPVTQDRAPRRRPAMILAAAAACTSMAFACGGISDPTIAGEKVATVAGALTGTSVPANARVALVWRTASSTTDEGGYAVGDDVPVVGGHFTMSLAVPAAAFFSSLDNGTTFANGKDTPVPAPAPVPETDGTGTAGGKSFASTITAKDNASGSVITQPLTAAVAGFVVYADTNGNGKLDLSGQYASSTDTILGGNRELVLTYLKDGGKLDYEKLRDRSGILPLAGFNLAWTDNQRWLPLDEVELKLDGGQGLPYPVCSNSGYYSGGGGGGTVNPVADSPPSAGGGADGTPPSPSDGDAGVPKATYPDPSDPNLHCDPDGHSFSYNEAVDCPTPPPAPSGLCSLGTDIGIGCAPSSGYSTAIPWDQPAPAGWPCPIAEDAGGMDASVDGGPAPDSGK